MHLFLINETFKVGRKKHNTCQLYLIDFDYDLPNI